MRIYGNFIGFFSCNLGFDTGCFIIGSGADDIEEKDRTSLQAETLVYENQEGWFTCEESLEFQATWAIRKLVPGPWDQDVEVEWTCPVYGANLSQVADYGCGAVEKVVNDLIQKKHCWLVLKLLQ